MVADRYRVVALAGRGGMGEVYKAEDLKLSQLVALKFLPESLSHDGAALARFHREVRTARQITHPNVCRVHDIGEVPGVVNGVSFLSMEYVDEQNLATLLRRIGHLPTEKGVQIARQICSGLSAAHQRGVLHSRQVIATVLFSLTPGLSECPWPVFYRLYCPRPCAQSGRLPPVVYTLSLLVVITGAWFSARRCHLHADVVITSVFAGLGLIALMRFGLIALVSLWTMRILLMSLPVTTNLSVWYAGRSMFVLAILVAVAAYACRVSFANQRVFNRTLLEE